VRSSPPTKPCTRLAGGARQDHAPGRAPVPTRAWIGVFLAGLLAGCQTVGPAAAGEGGPRDGWTPAPVETRVGDPERTVPARVDGLLPPLAVEAGLDPIVHSPAGADAAIQERVAFWVEFWTGPGADQFTLFLERMAPWEPFLLAELELRGLPLSLRYLPIVESGFVEMAVSRVGATGMWQLMAPTARELGLTVSAVVDDRRDPLQSTRAALDYLASMHEAFGSWYLALAAYNAGPGRIRGVVQRHAPDGDLPLDDAAYAALRRHMPAETREFVPRFLAAARAAAELERTGAWARPVVEAATSWDEVLVPDATSLDVVAWAAGVDEAEVRALNRHYLRGFTPAGEVRPVRIPAGTAGTFEERYALVPPEERISFMEHAVARGETLGAIAGRYGVRLADLQAANGRVDPRRLQIGQRLVIPVAGSRGAPPTAVARLAANDGPLAPERGARGEQERALQPSPIETAPEEVQDEEIAPEPESAAAAPPTHRVASGDNLWDLARRYGVGVADLQRWNGMGSSTALRVGRTLRVGQAGGAAPEAERTHRVTRGDTWEALARRFGVGVTALAGANGRTPRDVIRVGEVLRIP
jgi:membrane-bound lytic murein transglycosylase D